RHLSYCSVFLTDSAPTAIYPLSLHDALPIYQLALLQPVLRRPDHGGHRIDHDARLDVVVRAGLHQLRELLLDHLLEVLPLQMDRSEEHTSELQSRSDLVCRLLLEKKK